MVMLRLDVGQLEQELDRAAAEVAQEVAVELANNLRVEAPVGATGRLRDSIQIFRSEDGVVWLGTRVPYAKGVWKGQPPHEADFEAIEVWSRRVLGDESAAGPVWAKIKREGTEPNDFLGRAMQNTLSRVGQLRLDGF